ncbi:hypothetical protein D5086_022244 [Populus alba]|uniref:Sulfotransferase n=2 Tax=Populus alba TaxID=43335 RepID=A0A4V6A7I6_POPAL|nr:hypothetical protein D5086_0000195040 [Populus alba]
MCSFEELSSLEVNKNAEHRTPGISSLFKIVYSFRKGEIGDWANHLTPEMGARLDDIMEKKLKGSGLKLPSLVSAENEKAKTLYEKRFSGNGINQKSPTLTKMSSWISCPEYRSAETNLDLKPPIATNYISTSNKSNEL